VHWVHGEAKISASFVGELGKVVSCFILHDGMGRTAAFFFFCTGFNQFSVVSS